MSSPAEPPEFELFLYENSDHNLAPAGWAQAAARTVSFFDEELGER